MLYAKWLILLPALSVSGSCRHTTSPFSPTFVASMALADTYDLVQLRWIASNTGGDGGGGLLFLPGGLHLLCAPAAECDVVSFAVRALLMCVASKRALHRAAPHNIAIRVAGAVQI